MVPQFFVKCLRLKTEGIDIGHMATTLDGFLFCPQHQVTAVAFFAILVAYPKVLDF
ncbi:hypothetical protein D3C78_1751510 [compost metagenome]